MTKTLTEQWREGTLSDGEYYVKDWDGKIDWFVTKNKILWRDENNPMYASERIEVLAPVPSYDDYNELKQSNKYLKSGIETREKQIELLQKSLGIATKALKGVSLWANTGNGGEMAVKRLCDKALKEMEGVK